MKTIKEKDLFSILPFFSVSKKKLSTEEILSQMLKVEKTRKPVPEEKYITIQFCLHKRKIGVQGARLNWFDKEGKKIKTDGTILTTEEGRGMVCIPEKIYNELKSLRLDVHIKDKPVTFQGIEVNSSSDRVIHSGPQDLTLEILSPFELPSFKPPKRKTARQFSIAVSGKSVQIKKTIQLLKESPCFKIKGVFVDGQATREILKLCKNIKVRKIDHNIARYLEGTELLIDYSNHPQIKKLTRAQVLGTGKLKTLIVPDAVNFLGMEERLFSHFERKENSTQEDIRIFNDVLTKMKGK